MLTAAVANVPPHDIAISTSVFAIAGEGGEEEDALTRLVAGMLHIAAADDHAEAHMALFLR